MFPNSLSGRFLALTIIFVMLAEIFIFVPSIARYREDYMMNRLERGQIASLALLAGIPVGDVSHPLFGGAQHGLKTHAAPLARRSTSASRGVCDAHQIG